jgi:hypothetical protein
MEHMLDQARENMAYYVAAGRATFQQADALEALKALPATEFAGALRLVRVVEAFVTTISVIQVRPA